jgi:phenylacetate-coenzyme A ligase PaaK-like adenylate-forming protein
MNFDFSSHPLCERGYSRIPMSILDPAPKALLSAIMEVALIETGSRSAREHWQQVQLHNLLKHVVQRSAFWRARIGNRLSKIELGSLPILSRRELRNQVASEGSLLRSTDMLSTQVNVTSGSSGIPVRFYVSDFNSQYNVIRSIAQYFMEGRDLSLNRTDVRAAAAPVKDGLSVERKPSWTGSLAALFGSGAEKQIEYFALNDKMVCRNLMTELTGDDIGYLVCSPKVLDTLSSTFDLGFLRQTNTVMWICRAEGASPHLTDTFANFGIPVRQTYSSEEVGMIGAECSKVRGHFHVASSNVIVEVVDRMHAVDGVSLGSLLVTHLHSYATPFIRYDIGDLACLRENCPCGYDGVVIYNLHGRESSAIKHRDGRLSPFVIRDKELVGLAEFTEYRIRQTAFEKLVIEVGGRSQLSVEEVAAFTNFLRQRTGEEFGIEVRPCSQIDWGESRKKHGFRCEI